MCHNTDDSDEVDELGHGVHDHYHRYNPNAPKGKIGKKVLYLDVDGNPVPQGSDASHLYPPKGTTW